MDEDAWIEGLSDDRLATLAARLEPYLWKVGIGRPKVWGDANKLHLGERVSINDTYFNTSSGHIHVGDFVFFGYGVLVLAGSHLVDRIGEARQVGIPSAGLDIVIGRGAWIASGAIVIGPCRIGADAVVGAGSVVVEDVPDGWFYAGNPARPIRPVVSGAARPDALTALRLRLRGAVRALRSASRNSRVHRSPLPPVSPPE